MKFGVRALITLAALAVAPAPLLAQKPEKDADAPSAKQKAEKKAADRKKGGTTKAAPTRTTAPTTTTTSTGKRHTIENKK